MEWATADTEHISRPPLWKRVERNSGSLQTVEFDQWGQVQESI